MSLSADLGELKQIDLAQGTVRYRERGSGEPIVFIHGLLVNGDLWRKVVPQLADRFRCITPDLPRGRFVLIEDSYTFVSEDQPDALAKQIGGFLEGTSA
jgi:pimeloyl-ACP methyl ester carboxylesterase